MSRASFAPRIGRHGCDVPPRGRSAALVPRRLVAAAPFILLVARHPHSINMWARGQSFVAARAQYFFLNCSVN